MLRFDLLDEGELEQEGDLARRGGTSRWPEVELLCPRKLSREEPHSIPQVITLIHGHSALRSKKEYFIQVVFVM